MLPWTGEDFEGSLLTNRLLAISNHAEMLGGGEHSFIDLLCHLPDTWQVLAAVPDEGELTRRLKQKGLKTFTLPLPPIRSWKLFRALQGLEAHSRLYKSLRPDIIYANGSRAALYGGMIGRIFGIPVVWHCRIAETDPYLDPLLIRLSSKIVANSQATAARFATPFQKRIKVVYNGIDIHWLRQDNLQKPELIKDEWKVILNVARVSKSKRHDLVLSAFEEVAGANPRSHLVFLGAKDQWEPDWWEYLMIKSRESSFSDRIHWVGYVEDVRPWYRAAHMMVLTSENESFGRVIVEAMACGVPVIATRSGGIPEIIRHQQDGLLVTPGNVKELQAAFSILLRDQAFRDRYAKSAQKRAECFSLDSHVGKMVEILENTLALRKRVQ